MSERTFCDIATDSCLVSEESFCKFLTANDSGANKSHQAGILVSTTAMRMILGKANGNSPTKKNCKNFLE